MSELGQLIFTGIGGLNLTDDEKKFIESNNIGGVVLFSKNYENPAQLAELVNSIQVLRKEYPLFIAVDHEGGRVQRFKTSFKHFPSMYDISRLDSPKLCFQAHKIMAEELNACGINLDLSPVCDIWNNPNNKVIGDRAFGKDEETVSKYISSAIRGLQTSNVLACAKHFPGHGSTTKDSHYDLPIVKTDLDTLKNRELLPFIKAVKSRVEFVMMGHLIVDAIDEELPCSLSPKAHDFLRESLKFNKLILSDDMQMGAITDHFGVGEAAVKAIAAGTDIIEYRDFDQAVIAYEALLKAKKDKVLSATELTAKFKRVDECKARNIKDYQPVYIPNLNKVFNSRANEIFLEEIVERISKQTSESIAN